MIVFFLPVLSMACNYPIDPDSECTGKDTRTVLGEFSMIWIWISLTVTFIFGLMISVIRDIMPKIPRTDVSNRFYTGESRNIGRFIIEEGLLTGWIVSKTEWRFTYTSRWCLILLIVYTDMLMTGILYQRDYDSPDEFKSRDFVYGFVSMMITFSFFLISYFLLRIREKDEGFLWRKIFGFIFVALMAIICTIFIFVFTYQVHDDNDQDYTRLVDHWMSAFGYSMLLEVLISENIRLITRAVLIWSKKVSSEEPIQTNIELSSIERHKNPYENESFD